jgi:hypothetical protein
MGYITTVSIHLFQRLLLTQSIKELWARELGIDFLAITATLMFPR